MLVALFNTGAIKDELSRGALFVAQTLVWTRRGIVDSVALLPIANGGAGRVVKAGQGAAERRGLNLTTNRRGGTRLLMKTNIHVPDTNPRAQPEKYSGSQTEHIFLAEYDLA